MKFIIEADFEEIFDDLYVQLLFSFVCPNADVVHVVSKPFAVFPSEGSEYFICECLEGCWGIAHAKEHDQWFV